MNMNQHQHHVVRASEFSLLGSCSVSVFGSSSTFVRRGIVDSAGTVPNREPRTPNPEPRTPNLEPGTEQSNMNTNRAERTEKRERLVSL
jgi:hypothetical protein